MNNRLFTIRRFAFLSVSIMLFGCAKESPMAVDLSERPRAFAGPDCYSKVGSYVELNGTGELGREGTRLFYIWTESAQNPAHLLSYKYRQTQTLGFRKEGTYTFNLVAYDGVKFSDSDEVVVTVEPRTQFVFLDPGLEIQIRLALKQPGGDLTDGGLASVVSLYVGGPASFEGIEKCINLSNLAVTDWSYTLPPDLTPLSKLPLLDSLAIYGYYALTDVTPLGQMTQLRSLVIASDNISDISALTTLTSLESLMLAYTKVNDLSALSQLSSLKSLNLTYTKVSDLTPIRNLQSIRFLGVGDCQLQTIEPLVDGTALGSGDVVVLSGNPLDSVSVNVYIPELSDRGVVVHF